MLRLPELQRGFFRSLAAYTAAPDGRADFDPALLATVAGSDSLPPADRIRIYAEMYWARIVDALFEDFPRVAALLGVERFQALGRAYLACTPSGHPSLRYVGRGFADFLATRSHDVPPWAQDLARLEWARLTVFDAADPRPLRLEELRQRTPEEWPGLTLRLISACEIVRTEWPVHEIWAADDFSSRDWQPRDTALRVWRQGVVVYQASLDAPERHALERLRTRATFADVCTTLASVFPVERVAAEAGSLLLRWVEDAILEHTP